MNSSLLRCRTVGIHRSSSTIVRRFKLWFAFDRTSSTIRIFFVSFINLWRSERRWSEILRNICCFWPAIHPKPYIFDLLELTLNKYILYSIWGGTPQKHINQFRVVVVGIWRDLSTAFRLIVSKPYSSFSPNQKGVQFEHIYCMLVSLLKRRQWRNWKWFNHLIACAYRIFDRK